MSLAKFLRQLDSNRFSQKERKWIPKWLSGYLQHHQLGENKIPISKSHVISFLRSLRDSNIPAWRRLQASQALEAYQRLVLRKQDVDFHPILQKLQQLSRHESLADKFSGETVYSNDSNLVPGEGNSGIIDGSEPEMIQRMRRTLGTLHHPRSTEIAYVGWIRRLVRHLDDERLDHYGEREIGDFLADLAVTQHVAASTQNQALAACLFFYEKVLGRDLRFINTIRAKASQYRQHSDALARFSGNKFRFASVTTVAATAQGAFALRCLQTENQIPRKICDWIDQQETTEIGSHGGKCDEIFKLPYSYRGRLVCPSTCSATHLEHRRVFRNDSN